MLTEAPAWPVAKDGFRLRGQDITRTETFTDAAFAFAVTLLVISIDAVPTSYGEMLDALLGIPAFGIGFTILLIFWYGHWQWSRRYGLEDMPSIVLSALLVFAALVYVYPLKFIASALVYWLSGGRIAGPSLENAGQLYGMFAIYGLGFTAMSLIIAALNTHAYRRRDDLLLNELELHDTRGEIGAWLILASVGGLSIALALFTGPSSWVLPGWAYMLLPVLMPTYGTRSERARKRLPRG